jgi:hypothetical protein
MRCQRHSPACPPRTASIFSLTLHDVEGHQKRSPSGDLAGQDGLDAHRLSRADQVAPRAEVDRICRIARVACLHAYAFN